MLLGICPKCKDYSVLEVHTLSNRNVATVCSTCASTLETKTVSKSNSISSFANYLICRAQNYADSSNLTLLNKLKEETRKAFSCGLINQIESEQVERIFCVLHPI